MFRKAGYRKRLDKQTLDWVKGNPRHNSVDEECCPDFSCCDPELLASQKIRQQFYTAYLNDDDATSSRLLGRFLDKLIKKEFPDEKVHRI